MACCGPLAEHMADVFDTIKTICTQRPGIVENPVAKKIIIGHVQLHVLNFRSNIN